MNYNTIPSSQISYHKKKNTLLLCIEIDNCITLMLHETLKRTMPYILFFNVSNTTHLVKLFGIDVWAYGRIKTQFELWKQLYLQE